MEFGIDESVLGSARRRHHQGRDDGLVQSRCARRFEFGAGHCRFLGGVVRPLQAVDAAIEKIVRSYSGKVRLVKVNVDENQAIAAQLRVQSLPTVLAFRDGQPIDGFVGVQPENADQGLRRPACR